MKLLLISAITMVCFSVRFANQQYQTIMFEHELQTSSISDPIDNMISDSEYSIHTEPILR